MLPHLFSHVECCRSNEGLQNIVANRSLITFSQHFVMFVNVADFLLEQVSQAGYSELNWTWSLSNPSYF